MDIYSLLLDTSSERAILTLNKNEQPIIAMQLTLKDDFSSLLYASIKKIFEDMNLSLQSLSFISIGVGPGTFTGTRIGVAIAKSLSYALKIPLVSFCSLKCFVPPIFGKFLSITDAKSSNLYVLEGEKFKKTVIYRSSAHLIPKNSDLLSQNILVSPHFELLKDLSKNSKIFDAYPDANHLASLTFYKYTNKNFNLSEHLQILYLNGPTLAL